MNTVWVLVSVAIVLLVVEVISLRRPDDSWPTITAVMRKLPRWAVGLMMFGFGVLVGHFWWS